MKKDYKNYLKYISRVKRINKAHKHQAVILSFNKWLKAEGILIKAEEILM